ncbi:unspecified product [Leptomonas pyrrhocoris]|uniref:Unspecified product n=1 Tax=Leptomonas pyrrhocoris TaxID=157538 RepID=A0A0M9G631_LEPPY|nr:unspecified product [Leptomonas pyrrhocoris]KPA82969.1 unspecified product [Leptomonas pyrrhocoris]|eukprot:XP_015661408.1 unspecified product [Leptomonas pyrrhocoris]
MSRRVERSAFLKRSRDDEADTQGVGRAPTDHLFATPPRPTSGSSRLIPSNPFMAPVHCSRSPSVCTSGTEGGLSDDSVFVLDISSHSSSLPHRRSGLMSAPSEAEVAQWQRELSDFFTKLDERSLRVTPQ